MTRRAFFGFLAALPLIAKALPSLASSPLVPAPASAWTRAATQMTFRGAPIIDDRNGPPGMVYFVDPETIFEVYERPVSEQLSSYIEHTAPDPPPGWETFTCRYHDVPLTSFQPQDVPS